MLGQASRLVILERQVIGPLVQEDADGEFHRQGQQQDGEDLPDQADMPPQARLTSALNLYPTPRTVVIGAERPSVVSLRRWRLTRSEARRVGKECVRPCGSR